MKRERERERERECERVELNAKERNQDCVSRLKAFS
jgi:hypothetical protein